MSAETTKRPPFWPPGLVVAFAAAAVAGMSDARFGFFILLGWAIGFMGAAERFNAMSAEKRP